MNKKGFTLVEVLAMLTVIGIIMMVTIPNISGMVKNQKFNYLKGDAISMAEAAKMKSGKEKSIQKPKEGECILFTLNYLDENNNMVVGPNGGKYDRFNSIVLYTRKGSKYKYYVRLIEDNDGEKTGFNMIESENISDLSSSSLTVVDDDLGIKANDSLNKVNESIKAFGEINKYCNGPVYIKQYFGGD